MNNEFLTGVIEGFYGPPWPGAGDRQRHELYEVMAQSRLNTYLYAPKDNLKQRAHWREAHTAEELSEMRALVKATRAVNARFCYALSPGLDIGYSSQAHIDIIKQKFQSLVDNRCCDFALLFDDIPDQMRPEDGKQFPSFASAQASVANTIFKWLREKNREARFLFCPTAYCSRMVRARLGGENYLETIGRELLPDIQIFWTGPEIISDEISVAHAREVAGVLRRKPLIWDNLHANDYDGRRFFVGPYLGRPRELLNEVAGILTNPNCELPLNYIPLQTFGEFLTKPEYDPRGSYLKHLRNWRPSFADANIDDLVLLCDCYYLPHSNGPEAERAFTNLRQVLECGGEPPLWMSRLRQLCANLANIPNRPLFHALSRRIWDLREELDLLEKYIFFRANPSNTNKPFTSDFHLPKTYRGGFATRLQTLLVQKSDGSFSFSP